MKEGNARKCSLLFETFTQCAFKAESSYLDHLYSAYYYKSMECDYLSLRTSSRFSVSILT
jgi:hypothetical protein